MTSRRVVTTSPQPAKSGQKISAPKSRVPKIPRKGGLYPANPTEKGRPRANSIVSGRRERAPVLAPPRAPLTAPVNAFKPTGVASRGRSTPPELVSDVDLRALAELPTDDSDLGGVVLTRDRAARGGVEAGPPQERTAQGGSSLVHTEGITRPAGPRSVRSETTQAGDSTSAPRPGRRGHDESWTQSLGPATAEHREALARHHDTRARKKRAQLRLKGASEREVLEETRWDTTRAKGHRERISRVLACGAEEIRVTCICCEASFDISLGCGSRLYCFQCRDSYAARRRGQFLAARNEVVADAALQHLFDVRRRGGRYSEKFLTLTVPHIEGEPVQQRIQRLLAPWPIFLKKLNRYLKDHGIGRVEWFRVIEWTEGKGDLHGHPHFHLWIFSPFLDHNDLRQMWREALVLSGCPPELCEHPIIYIEAVRDSQGGVRELIKYLTKDITAGGKKLPAEVYAEVIKALEGTRSTQGSKGFIGRAKKAAPACKDCGSLLPKDVRKKRKQVPNKSESTE